MTLTTTKQANKQQEQQRKTRPDESKKNISPIPYPLSSSLLPDIIIHQPQIFTLTEYPSCLPSIHPTSSRKILTSNHPYRKKNDHVLFVAAASPRMRGLGKKDKPANAPSLYFQRLPSAVQFKVIFATSDEEKSCLSLPSLPS